MRRSSVAASSVFEKFRSAGSPSHEGPSQPNAMADFRASTTHCLSRARTGLLGLAFAVPLLLAACAKAPPLPPSPKPGPPIVDCRVPDLIEDFEQTIEPQLARAKLHLGNVTGQESNQRPGTVVRQLPPRATTVKCGSRVDVWIAVPPSQSLIRQSPIHRGLIHRGLIRRSPIRRNPIRPSLIRRGPHQS